MYKATKCLAFALPFLMAQSIDWSNPPGYRVIKQAKLCMCSGGGFGGCKVKAAKAAAVFQSAGRVPAKCDIKSFNILQQTDKVK